MHAGVLVSVNWINEAIARSASFCNANRRSNGRCRVRQLRHCFIVQLNLDRLPCLNYPSLKPRQGPSPDLVGFASSLLATTNSLLISLPHPAKTYRKPLSSTQWQAQINQQHPSSGRARHQKAHPVGKNDASKSRSRHKRHKRSATTAERVQQACQGSKRRCTRLAKRCTLLNPRILHKEVPPSFR